jgi:hypothetical protein
MVALFVSFSLVGESAADEVGAGGGVSTRGDNPLTRLHLAPLDFATLSSKGRE